MTEKLKIGIVGLGAIGKVHANAHKAIGESEITAICDVDNEKLEAVSKEYGISQSGRYANYMELLSKADVDAVLVCVGNILHKSVAIAALQAGKHVFLEKPMALNATEANEIKVHADKAKGILQMGMVWRFDPAARIVRKWVEEGRFGNIYHIRAHLNNRRGIPGLGGWFTTMAESGGGPMIDLGVHWFDLSMYLSGYWKPTTVSAKTFAKFGPRMGDYKYVGMWAGPPKIDGVFDVEDYSTGFVRFGEDAVLSFETTWAANAEDEMFVEILGEKAGVRAFDGKPLVIMTEHADGVANISPQFNNEVNKFELQAESFVKACRGEHPPLATAEQGLTVMKLIDAIYRSSEENKEVSF